MITEDYVSFETAKLKKEKGFDEICSTAYETITNVHEIEQCSISSWGKLGQVKRPTLQMAIKWLREVHKLFIAINMIPDNIQKPYFFKLYVDKKIYNFPLDYSVEFYTTYEEACEAAIKYCLENLI